MGRTRLEAFSDGVIAILITIMVLELKVPQGTGWEALGEMRSVLLSYLLSFVFLGIYWANHHHMLHTVDRVDGTILWANLHLLFWLSLIPFVTAWMGRSPAATVPTACYGIVLILSALAYTALQWTIIWRHGPGSRLARAVGTDRKGKVSVLLYAVGIAAAFASALVSQLLYVAVALIWLVPDRRIESALGPGRAADAP
jgi:uncharacterized membrane protein